MTRRSRQQGFTLIEVMIAIGIMTVGSLGILSMHHAVSRANREAREMNTAIAITERWIERVERDTLLWTAEGSNTPELQSTAYLRQIGNAASGTDWFTPIPADLDSSYGFDFFGDDTRNRADIVYCVNLRLNWLDAGSSVRVDVRTYWLRTGHLIATPTHADWVDASAFRNSDCDAATASGWGFDNRLLPNLNSISASTVVTWVRRDAP